MKNYWIERAELRKKKFHTSEILIRINNSQLKQIKESKVDLIDGFRGLIKFLYKNIDAVVYKDLLDWKALVNKANIRKTIVRIRKYDGLEELLSAWDLIDPKPDFMKFTPARHEIALRYSRITTIK